MSLKKLNASEQWNYPHFARKEMMCKCGCGGVPPDGFMQALELVRTECAFAFIVSSGYRCPEYNKKIGGTYDGPHTRGAADILIYGQRALKVLEVALKYGFTGYGVDQAGPIKNRFIHLDTVPVYAQGFLRPTIWGYE